jgi:hypothetical protein
MEAPFLEMINLRFPVDFYCSLLGRNKNCRPSLFIDLAAANGRL